MASKRTMSQQRYDRAHTRRVVLKLNTTTDAAIIAWLEGQPSMQGAVRQLIRDQITRDAVTTQLSPKPVDGAIII